MSFFTNGTDSVVIEGSIDQLMADKNIQPSIYENYIEGAFAAVAESTENSNRLMQAIGINESTYYAQTGKEYVYTEGTLSSIWTKIKEILLKIKNKIMALIKRFVAMFDKFFASDKDFVKKYKKRILLADTKDISYEGYKFPGLKEKYTVESISMPSKADVSIDTGVIKDEDELNTLLDNFRGKLCKSSSGVEASEFSSEFKEMLYGDKETMEGSELEISKQIGYIENYSDAKKAAEKLRTATEKFFKECVKKIDDMEKEFTKDKDFDGSKEAVDPSDPSHKAAGRDIVKNLGYKRTLYTRSGEAFSVAIGIHLQALKDRNRQARAICVKVMSKGGTLQKESTSFEYPAYGSGFLENVKFI